ncbi:MAG: RsmE family RNA methyltransferase [Leptospiraceae bacterium]|nr:RNA methyltransferase [Leptospiraceae bacterium]MCK6380599.1 RsmE family RNA methyltransferase [Leptospiraceae bacterium]
MLILEESEKIYDNYFKLIERKSSHIIQILKSKPKDTLQAGTLNRDYGLFHIEKIEDNIVYGLFRREEETVQGKTFPCIRLFSSIQRPQTIKKILQLAATLQVEEVFFFIARKSEKSYLNSPIWNSENLNKELILGLEQGKKIHLPKIKILKNVKEVFEISNSDVKFVFHPNGQSMNLFKSQISKAESISNLIGPESGFSESELDRFQEMGFQKLSLSSSVLRTETAISYSLAQIELICSEENTRRGTCLPKKSSRIFSTGRLGR